MATKKTVRRAVKIGAGIAGIAGTLAGAYLLFEHTKPQQKKAKVWVMKARKSAAVEAKKLSRVGEKEYHRIVEKSLRHYGAVQKVGAPEIASAVRDAKAEWKHLQAIARKQVKVSRPAKKVAKKKPARKAAKKAVRRK